MHLLLTDRLACPRCGPAFGLILLADRMADRRVDAGALGCANCRERYPIRGGVADLRPPPRSEPPIGPATDPADDDPELGVPVAAAMGAADAPRGHVLLLGRAAGIAAAVAAVLPDDVEVVEATPWMPRPSPAVHTTRLLAGEALPFFDATFAGVAVHGSEADAPRLREAARVLARGHRVVVVDPPDDAQARLGGAGLTRFARGGRVVAGGR